MTAPTREQVQAMIANRRTIDEQTYSSDDEFMYAIGQWADKAADMLQALLDAQVPRERDDLRKKK